MLTTEVASYSILTIQLIVVCLTLVRWTTIDTAKALTSQQKEKPHGKKNNLTAKRITSRQKEKPHGKKNNLTAKRKTSQQKEKPHGKKKNLTAKRNTHGKQNNLKAKRKRLTAKFLRYREDILILISFAVRSWLFFLP